ncbi:MAG: alpha/beta hydrolase-fold protein [Woeseiaceae bacterium]|nr:alpha/beta hydrolase-fold protein [Woeseiaceae bacterium]
MNVRAVVICLLLALAACGGPSLGGGNCCEVTVNVTVPEGSGTVYMPGNRPELGPWSPDAYAMSGDGPVRTATLSIPKGSTFEYKFTLGSWERQAVDTDNRELVNFRVVVTEHLSVDHEIRQFRDDPLVFIEDWQGSDVKGTLVYWTDVESDFLDYPRNVAIWLPPGYDEAGDARYPVLYMHDGMVLFDPRFGGGGGGDIWEVDDVVVELIEEGRIRPVIVVGAWNSQDRFREYSPWHGAPDYARFLIEELMPRVNAEFRTLTGPADTAAMGASMGGLLSWYLVTRHPDNFGACGCMSSSMHLSERVIGEWAAQMAVDDPDETPFIVRDIENGLVPPDGVRYWLDYGSLEADPFAEPHDAIHAWLVDSGLEEGDDFVLRVYEGAGHNEAAWSARMADPLVFIFGNR